MTAEAQVQVQVFSGSSVMCSSRVVCLLIVSWPALIERGVARKCLVFV